MLAGLPNHSPLLTMIQTFVNWMKGHYIIYDGCMKGFLFLSYWEVDIFISYETRYRISDNLFRLESFRAHLVLFSVQKSVVTDAILSLNDRSFSKSHSNCKQEDKRNSWKYILLLKPCEVKFIQELSKTTLRGPCAFKSWLWLSLNLSFLFCLCFVFVWDFPHIVRGSDIFLFLYFFLYLFVHWSKCSSRGF